MLMMMMLVINGVLCNARTVVNCGPGDFLLLSDLQYVLDGGREQVVFVFGHCRSSVGSGGPGTSYIGISALVVMSPTRKRGANVAAAGVRRRAFAGGEARHVKKRKNGLRLIIKNVMLWSS